MTHFPARGGPRSVTLVDMNGDGRLDLAAANSDSGDVSVLAGNGDGSFEPQERFAAGGADWLAAGDRDREPDLTVADYSEGSVAILVNKSR